MSRLSKIPLLKQVWAKIREQKILKKHAAVADYWKPLIEQYFSGKLDRYAIQPKQNPGTEKIIWQYWGQGIQDENLPEVVKLCFESVDRYRGDYQVIRLDDATISDYLDFPDFVYAKLKNGTFNKTFFSDLLRVALLKVYGGVWLDATILMTDTMPSFLQEGEYFVFQRDDEVQEKNLWMNSYAYYWNWNPRFRVNMLNSIFYSKANGIMVSSILDLLLSYWKENDEIIDYFFFQILYDELVKNQLKAIQCEVISDTYPHMIQAKLSGAGDYFSYKDSLDQVTVHKLTYKGVDPNMVRDLVESKINKINDSK